ncbi:hypothetical protein ACERII_19595 [Evansella sp. AB-rgal1]
MIIEFMSELSKLLGKQSILSVEGLPDIPLFTVKPDGQLIKNTKVFT